MTGRRAIILGLLGIMAIIGACLTWPVPYALADAPTATPSACWNLDEESGTRAAYVGGVNLTDNNTVGYTTGVVSNAASFVSANLEYLSVSDAASISSAGGDFTIVVWFYAAHSAAWKTMLDKRGGTNEYYVAKDNNDYLWAKITNPSECTKSLTAGTWTVNAWNMLAMKYTLADHKIYLKTNGNTESSATCTDTGAINDSTNALNFGKKSTGSDYWDGAMDQVAIYNNSALTNAELDWIYNSGSGRSCADLSGGGNTPTPTATATSTVTPTPTVTLTPTITLTPVVSLTPTPGTEFILNLSSGQQAKVDRTVTYGDIGIFIIICVIILMVCLYFFVAVPKHWFR